MAKPREIPFSKMQKISGSGVFVKRFGHFGRVAMKQYAHRDDYYIVVMLTEGSAAVEIDFEKKMLVAGDILIVSPWQVHAKPAGEVWDADGWMVAFSPEMLSETEMRAIDEYSVAPQPLKPGAGVFGDMVGLCGMLERYRETDNIANALAAAVKSFVVASLDAPDAGTPGRYRTITLKLRKLLEQHLVAEKSPAVYASMLNLSEVYLNEAVKGATGLSAGEYIRSRAVVQAKRQLAYTSLSAKEIAYALGYEDYAYFSKLFKKSAGCSPSDYRKNLK